MGASTECLQHLLCLHYSELVTKIFKETDFKCKLKGKCLQAAGTKKKKKVLPAASCFPHCATRVHLEHGEEGAGPRCAQGRGLEGELPLPFFSLLTFLRAGGN